MLNTERGGAGRRGDSHASPVALAQIHFRLRRGGGEGRGRGKGGRRPSLYNSGGPARATPTPSNPKLAPFTLRSLGI